MIKIYEPIRIMNRIALFARRIWILFGAFPFLLYAEQPRNSLVIKDDRGQPVFSYETSHALLIGIGQYTKGWPELESIPEELAMVEALLNQQGFQVVKYLDLNARDLRKAFKNFMTHNGSDKNARLFFFFGGHGHIDNEKGYLVPTDAPAPHVDRKGFLRKALRMDQILTWAREIEAKHALFLFDSCSSDAMLQTSSLPEYPPPISQTTGLPVRQFITGGGLKEILPLKSAFTPAFVDALRFGWGDLNQDGYVTGTELGLYLRNKMPVSVEQTPQFTRIKESDLALGDFVFVSGLGPQTVGLTILSNVDNVSVFIDGEYSGITRLERELPMGLHTVQAEKKGYTPFESTIYLQHTQILYVSLEPQADRYPQPGRSSVPFSKRWTEPITGMDFVWIPGGCYLMGCISENNACNHDEKPVHEVCVDDFWIGKYEVTQAQWRQVMEQNPSRSGKSPNYPVENVSYHDIQEFTLRLNRKAGTEAYRLPTEAEWEYAARAGSNTADSFGSDVTSLDQYAWYFRNSGNGSHPVGQLDPNAYEVYDMHGNVWEWCQDWYHDTYYTTSPSYNPRGPLSGLDRVIRGGGWNHDISFCRSGYRTHYPPDSGSSDLGFRLVRRPE